MPKNSYGKEICETQLFPHLPEAADISAVKKSIALLCQHLKVSIVQTNDTVGGFVELQLREDE